MNGVDWRWLRAENQAMETGVYAILNLLNGNVYIGSTAKSFGERFRVHRRELRADRHHSRPLQAAWNKYGESVFVFAPVIEVSPEDAVRVEQTFIDGWRPSMNVSPTARSCFGVKRSEHTKSLLSAVQKRLSASPDVRARRSEAQLIAQNRPSTKEKKDAAIKAAHSRPEVRARVLAAAQKRIADPEFRERLSIARKAACADPEVRARMSAAAKEACGQPGYRQRRIDSLKRTYATSEYAVKRAASDRTRYAPIASLVDEIREAIALGESGSAIASRLGISQATVSRIKNNLRWIG